MDYQAKQFTWKNHGTCLIIVARGLIDSQAFLRVLREMVEASKPLVDCKVLVDLQDITWDAGIEELIKLKIDLRAYATAAAKKLKLAMLTTRQPVQYGPLHQLTLPLSQAGIDVSVFYETGRAIDWLSEESKHRCS